MDADESDDHLPEEDKGPEQYMLSYPLQDPFMGFSQQGEAKVVVKSNEIATFSQERLQYTAAWYEWINSVNGMDSYSYDPQSEEDESDSEEQKYEEQPELVIEEELEASQDTDSQIEDSQETEIQDEEFDQSIFQPAKDRSNSYLYLKPKYEASVSIRSF